MELLLTTNCRISSLLKIHRRRKIRVLVLRITISLAQVVATVFVPLTRGNVRDGRRWRLTRINRQTVRSSDTLRPQVARRSRFLILVQRMLPPKPGWFNRNRWRRWVYDVVKPIWPRARSVQ